MVLNGILMSGDTPVAEIRHGSVMPLEKTRMPLYLRDHDDILGWLEERAIDRHRTNSRILKKVLRLSDSSDLAAVLHSHGAAITDDYWFREESEPDLTWRDVRFSADSFAEIALTGSFSSYSREFTPEELKTGTPELTNIGSYEKCWRIENGAWWLYKNENELERFSELFIAALGKALGFSTAEYQESGDYVKTRDFTEGRMNFEPASAIVGDNEDYALNYDRLTALKPSLGKEYLDILFMDALCFNMDRHTKNYGVLRDRATGKVLGMAPNFDNNIALISRGYGSDPTKTSPLLIDAFLDVLRAKGLPYSVPAVDRELLRRLAFAVLPSADIRRDYVVNMVESRWQLLTDGIGGVKLIR